MPISTSLTADKVQEALIGAVQEVFATVLDRAVTADSHGHVLVWQETAVPSVPAEADIARIVGSVAFSGVLTGQLSLEFELPFANRWVSQIHATGYEAEPSAVLVNDAVGEIAGMVAGRVGHLLGNGELPCRLSLPAIIRGNTIRVEPVSSVRRFFSHFLCGESRIVAELFIQDKLDITP